MSASGLRKPGGHAANGGPGRPQPAPAADRPRQAWVGIDVSSERIRVARRGTVPLLVLALVVVLGATLGVAALRIDLLRTRYAVSAAMERENELIEEQRQLIVRRRQLRDPVALAVKARERGFRPPAHVVSIPDPTLGRVEDVVAPQPVIAHSAVAAVSAGPGAQTPSTGDAWE